MYHAFGKSIRVFYASPEKSGDISRKEKATEAIDTNAVMQFSETLLENFLKQKTKQEAAKYITRVIEKLKQLSPNLAKECQKKIDIMKQWMDGKSIFDERGNKKDITKNDVLKAIKISLGIKETGKKIEVKQSSGITEVGKKIETKDTKAVEEFKQKNPINTYKDTLLAYCIKHPILAENNSYLNNQKREIDTLAQGQPKNTLQEYSAVVETLIGIVKTDEFGNYTGLFDKGLRIVEGEKENIQKYNDALNQTLNTAIKTQSVMAGNDLIGRIEAQDKANEKAAIEAENKLREKINPTTLYNIFGKKDVTPEAIKARINSLQKDIKTFTGNEKYRPRIHEMQDVWDIMRTAEKAAENDVFTSGIVEDFQRRFHGTTKEGFLKELKDSLEKKEYAIIAFGDKNSTGTSKFNSYSRKDMELMFTDPNHLNVDIWKQIINDPYWEANLITEGGHNLWAVGEYIQKTPGTRLLTIIDDPSKKLKVKKYFLEKAAKHTIDSKVENTPTVMNYEERLYERLKGKLKGISKEIFITKILIDGKIQGNILYQNLQINGLINPQDYINFEASLIADIGKYNQELKNENTKIAENISKKGMKKIDDIGINLAKENIKILEKDKKILDAIKYQDIVSLDPANSSKVMRILIKYPTKNPDIAAIIKLLGNKSGIDANNKNIGGAVARKEESTKKGVLGIENIKQGKTTILENSAGEAYAAQEVLKEQKEYIKKDTDITTLLKKYGYTVEMLNNPVIAFECYNKVSKYPNTPENQRLLAYLESIKKYESIKIRNYDTIIKEVGIKDAASYVSSISGKKESTKSIEAYQFISKNIIPNVEYERNNLTEGISRMNVGETKTLSAFSRSTENFPASSFVNNYSISLAAPNAYEIRSNSGVLVANSLDVEQASELINDMSVFADTGLDDLIPYIPYLKKRGSQNGMNIGLDGESSTKEQTIMLKKIYSTIFGENIETSNMFDIIRAFKSKTRDYSNPKDGMRIHLKKSGFIREDNSIESGETIRKIFDTGILYPDRI